MRVAEESIVDFREIVVDVERESAAYGFGADEKFLNEGSDMRGAFQGKRRIFMQLLSVVEIVGDITNK